MHAVYELLRDTVRGFMADGATRKAAALSYYTLFSLAPLLIISIAVAGAFFGAEAARGEIIAQLRGLLGEEAAVAVEGMVKSAARPGAGFWAAIIGVVTLLFGATTAFAELKQSLDQIWEAPSATLEGLWYTVRTRLLSFGVILSIGFLLLVSLVFSAAVAALQQRWLVGDSAGAWLQVLNATFSYFGVAAMFGMLYKLLPSVRIAWGDVVMGSLVTAALFTIGKFVIGLYLGRSAISSSYGAAGAVIVILVWVYYSALIFLFGAEFTKVFARRQGSHARKARKPSGPIQTS